MNNLLYAYGPTNVCILTMFKSVERLVRLMILQSSLNDNLGHILKIFEIYPIMCNTHAILFWNSPAIASYVFFNMTFVF
jgi:hypothetical protein